MYATRQIPRYQYGSPQYAPPPVRTAYNQPGGSVTTGPGQPQPSPYQQYMPLAGSLGLKAGTNYLNQQANDKAFDAAVKNNFGLDNPPVGSITPDDAVSVGHELGDTYPGYYTGPQGAAASNAALDAESPYAAQNLQNGGLLGDTGAPIASTPVSAGTPAAADAATAGSTVGAGAAGDAAAGTADAGLLGTGAAAGGEAAAGAAAAGEGTAAAAGATNFWNPLGWAALAGLAAYQLGLFD